MNPASAVRRLLQDRAGVTAVEFALVMPILSLFLFGSWIIGWQIYCGEEVRHAVELGSRIYVANPGATIDDLNTAVSGHLMAVPISSVSLSAAPGTVGTASTEHISWSYQTKAQFPLNQFLPPRFAGSIDVPTATTG